MHDNKQPANQPAVSGSLIPDIVKEIPVATPDAKSQAPNEDDDLDKIMHEVGRDIRQIGKKKPKRSWYSRSKKNKTGPKFSARLDEQLRPAPVTLTMPLKSVHPAVSAQSAKLQTATPAVPTKTKQTKTAQRPIGAVLLALLVTSCLIAAAYYAYK